MARSGHASRYRFGSADPPPRHRGLGESGDHLPERLFVGVGVPAAQLAPRILGVHIQRRSAHQDQALQEQYIVIHKLTLAGDPHDRIEYPPKQVGSLTKKDVGFGPKKVPTPNGNTFARRAATEGVDDAKRAFDGFEDATNMESLFQFSHEPPEIGD